MSLQQLVKQKGFQFPCGGSCSNEAILDGGFFEMRDWQKKAFELLKNSSHMVLNAPMGSGKSWLMCLLAAHKMREDISLRCILVVPQTIIAPGFVDAKLLMPDGEKLHWHIKHNLCNKKPSKGTASYIEAWLEHGHNYFDERMLICTHATVVALYRKLKANNRLYLLKNLLLWVDEAHHVKNIVNGDFEGSVINNGLGELVTYLLKDSIQNVQLGLTTASFFRGDRCSLLTEAMESKFKRFNLPYDEYLRSMKYLKSFSFDFLVCGPDYTNAIESLVKNRIGKDIIYVPHPTSQHSTGNKYQEAESIIEKYKNVHGGVAAYTVEGMTILKRDDGEFKLLNLVDEGGRFEKKNYIDSPLFKSDPAALDVIITLGMFKEGANWIYADRCIIVGARSSLVEMIQIIGRPFRDAPGKTHVEVVQLLPFSLDQQDDDSFRENLNNYLKAIFASLILENILNPIKIKVSSGEKKRDESDLGEKRVSDVLSVVLPDEVKRLELIEDVRDQLINIMVDNKLTDSEVPVLWDEYQKIIPRILDEYGVCEHKEAVAKQIWGMLARKTLHMQGLAVENIDFDILQKTFPLGFLLGYTSGVCGIDTFNKLREAIQQSRVPWRPFEDAKTFVKALGLLSETQWRLYISGEMPQLPPLPRDIPKAPWVAYKDSGWKSSGDFLGTNLIAPRYKKYRSYDEASDFAKSLNLARKDDWFLYLKGEFQGLPTLPSDIPACPDKTYRREAYGKKWDTWGQFLNTGTVGCKEKSKNFKAYADAQKFARDLKLKTAEDWRKYVKGDFKHLPKLPFGIPRQPHQVYAEWINWPSFLGSEVSKHSNKRVFWSFEKSRNFVRSLGIKNQNEWVDYCGGRLPHLPVKPFEIPANPQFKYKRDGWKGFADWLGYDKK